MVEFYDKGMLNQRTDVFLILHYVLFLILKNELFAHHLHSIVFSVVFAPHQVNLAEPANCQAFNDLVFVETIRVLIIKTL